ncbi:MAG: response regulator [Treponema sp.]|nr:response regulator [Treponema sp.]
MENERNKILIVDDEKMNILTLAHCLKEQYDIIVATDGETGLEAALKHKPDLVLLDIIMPEMNGFDVIEKLKESEATRHIPVIFISGLNNQENDEKGMSLGAADFITKPFSKVIVKARVDIQFKLMEQEKTIEELKKLLGDKGN